MNNKLYVPEQPTGQRRNQKRERESILRKMNLEIQHKKNLWELGGGWSSKGKFIEINAFIHKKEKSQINSLPLHLKGT